MCGLLYSQRLFSEKRFAKALSEMSFRGPDASAAIHSEFGSLGHNRLKIFGVDDSYNQPFWSKSKEHVIIFNGAIYNYQELSEKYSVALGTSCDTELLVELYEKLGAKMLQELNGMFAFLIINTRTGSRFVARDRLGIKPLFFTKLAGNEIFCSEIKPILSLLDNTPRFDEYAVRQYKLMRGFYNGRTLYEGINTFPAGCYEQDGRIQSYWSLPDEESAEPDAEELRDLIVSAVEMRCRADVPVATYLSGGLDSSLVTALTDGLASWSAGFEDCNEFKWSRRVAQYLQVPHHEQLVDENEFVNALNVMLSNRREPICVPNEVMIYLMTLSLSQKATVVLSGEGADELFFGYDRIFTWAATAKWDLRGFAERYCYSKVEKEDLDLVASVVEPCMRGNAEATVAAFFQLQHLHGLLRRLDYASMLAGVEARVPFVDHRLVELMAGVPASSRMKGAVAKQMLKQIAGEFLPEDVIYREKIGFPVPLEKMNSRGFSNYPEFFAYNLKYLGA